ncbi:hypothetical protein APHAL10511_003026 [Amanita phalloides]|nr:hypothetical protein APHAL10511_003026 [Amanita phalloides]
MSFLLPTDIKRQYDESGYVIISNLIAPSEFTPLQDACTRVIEKTRNAEWMHRRTVGRQFPPFDTEKDVDIWGVQHVMHPDLGESAFINWYTSDNLTKVATVLLDCKEEHLQMELFNLLINPERGNFALRWHRDDVSEKATEEDEIRALNVWHHGVQWNTALYRDACLFIVPGSHKVQRTPEQRRHSECITPPNDPGDMPGAMKVILEPGDTVFYNSNILHCAAYNCDEVRATLHASIGDVRGGATRARNVLQHGLDWIKSKEFRRSIDSIANDKVRSRALTMWATLLKMQENADAEKLGYSLSN